MQESGAGRGGVRRCKSLGPGGWGLEGAGVWGREGGG